MKRRKLVTSMVALGVVAGLLGGGIQSQAADGEKKKVTLWTWATGQFDAVQEAYFASHPDADWEFEEVVVASEDYLTKLQQGYASGGDMPDLLMAEMGWRGSAFALDIWENLEAEPYNFDRSVLLDSVISSITNADDQVIGVENALNPAFMMYKRDLAKEYLGTDDPDEISAMVSDWDSFIATGKKIKEASDGAVNMIPGIDTLVQPLVNQTGLRWRDGNKLMVQENFTDTIELMLKLKEAEIDAGLDVWTPAWNASFGQGNVFCYPGSCWFQSYVIEPNDPEGSGNWGVAEVPGGAYNWGGIWWGMYNQSENKDAVAAWMKYELSKEGAQNKYDLIHFYPGVKSAYEDDYLNKPNEFFGGENVTELYLKEMDEMTVLRPIADDALFYNSMTFFAQSLEGTADEIAEKVEEDIISSNPEYEK